MPSVHGRPTRDLGVALLLAGLLTVAWSLQNWANLSALRLPDTDDVVRLQQIRDWLGGQAFGDLAQHRLGAAPGLEMHWSRLPDLVPAALIALLSPLLGAHAAELVAVIVWPALLFAAALALVASLARSLGASGPLATLIAALAFPATTLFMPGRIDHHGLQLVLLLVVARAAVGQGRLGAGAGAGIATAASLTVGLETAPLLGVGAAAIVLRWVREGRNAQPRLAGYAVGLVLSLAAASVLLRTSGWNWPGCDGFNYTFWRAAQLATLAPLGLAVFGFVFETPRHRGIATLILAPAGLFGALALSPGCVAPYGEVDPLLAQLWLANVAEAQPLLGAPLVHAIGYAGLMLAGIAAGIWALRRSRDDRWLVILALQLAALALTWIQLRGAYAGALLAAPALAMLITVARTRSVLALVPAWLISAGMLYPIVAGALVPAGPERAGGADCTGPGTLARLAALPPGTLIAPIDLGAFALAATPHRVIAAPYHRNTAGNDAMYRFFLGPIDDARRLADTWHVNYVAYCPGDFAELGTQAASSARLSGALAVGKPPAWLRPISPPGEVPMLFEVER
ncbi:hypothetical protein RZN05_12190 [Sphingomonas sp. HF-S4]|uniref:Glycosyltransferase RgtA/B/C/D-like domain-containing protein n=1 Tax=Sphingomonas agrestis TaxID=3080540 RepID=A0ABU3Y8N2_9SPHN|nr:hypothetical protein [Sphingomonas sp. HF-S4]MDV3457746.1 hypothetical protein [Sphingomonas sp. HF-S4]